MKPDNDREASKLKGWYCSGACDGLTDRDMKKITKKARRLGNKDEINNQREEYENN